MTRSQTLVLSSAFLAVASASLAQQPAAQAAPPAVGDMAPDFTIKGVIATGPVADKKLSDYRGKTVVLWFFVRARTRG